VSVKVNMVNIWRSCEI